MIMKVRFKLLLVAALAVPMALGAQTKKWDSYREQNGIGLPKWNIKTNLLADITLSPNLGFEFATGERTSLEIVGQWNPFTFSGKSNSYSWQHWGVQPEFRYWLRETFRGHFFGLQATYADYNIGALPKPFSDHMRANRFDGDLYGAGISWGHRWNFSRRWGLEVTAAVGYLHKGYDQWECESCGDLIASTSKNYFGPTEIGVNLIFGGGARKAAPVVAPPAPAPVVRQRYEPNLTPSFITPAAEAVKARAESGSAYIEYQVGRHNILNNFRNNAAELADIDGMVNRVKNDPDATVKGVTLVGHASPEGSSSSNQALSDRRAQALKEYIVKTHALPATSIATSGAGEDWAGLGRMVGESNVAGKQALLAVINGSADYDARDRQMAAASSEGYNAIKNDIYPRLRRTDYKLDYEVAPISVERGKQVMRTNPRNLSLNELFLIADSYPAGSNEFREVMDIAARTYPDSDVANSNAAAAAIQRGDLASAATMLGKVKSHNADWNNNMGVLSFLQGNATAAAGYFRAAGTKASVNASELERYFRSVE
jgi:outer membrane protein OmpA-like peptidoglycan-associated protein